MLTLLSPFRIRILVTLLTTSCHSKWTLVGLWYVVSKQLKYIHSTELENYTYNSKLYKMWYFRYVTQKCGLNNLQYKIWIFSKPDLNKRKWPWKTNNLFFSTEYKFIQVYLQNLCRVYLNEKYFLFIIILKNKTIHNLFFNQYKNIKNNYVIFYSLIYLLDSNFYI